MSVLSRFKHLVSNNLHTLQAVKANFQQEFPYRKLKIIGVTGTNGKTTTTQMIYHILKENGFKVGYLSTISAKIGDKELDTGLHVTTPDPWDVPKYLRMMVDAGMEYVVIEATSQGLEQNRLWGIKFEAATITNIQSDHLDYHLTWENYAQAKFMLIHKLVSGGLAVFNHDDTKTLPWLTKQLHKLKKKIVVEWYSKSELTAVNKTFSGYDFIYQGQEFKLPVLGDYNLENALAAIRISAKYLPLAKISSALATFPVPVGRMETIQADPFAVIVDFAHTPDALQAALSTLISIKPPTARIITVFGCAGKRDKDRRKMGAVSAKLADITILTAEDPRDEKLADINNEIFRDGEEHKGVMVNDYPDHRYWVRLHLPSLKLKVAEALEKGKKPFILFNEDKVDSRIDAIDCALKLARTDDIVFITGKAHEQSLAFGTTEFPWDERKIVRDLLKEQHA